MPSLAIAVPALNEAKTLPRTIAAIRHAVPKGYQASIIIADNGSTDETPMVGRHLAGHFSDIRYLRIEKRGKGLAIRTAWESFPADISVFMDADLATDLSALIPLIKAVENGAHVAIGSRTHPQSSVARTRHRQFFSSGYRWLLQHHLNVPFSDAPCGFKAISASAREILLPKIRNQKWFFDTELLIHAHRLGLAITEIPVRWRDGGPTGRQSKALPLKIIREYLSEIRRLKNSA